MHYPISPRPTAVGLLAIALAFAAGTALGQRGTDRDRDLGARAWQPRTHALTGQFGVGWFALFNDVQLDLTGDESDAEATFTFDGGPTGSLAYEYRVGRSFSVGGALSLQGNRLTGFRDDFGAAVPGESRIRRTFVSSRLLWHYGRAANLELYSGLRAGVTVYRTVATDEVARRGLGFFGTPGISERALLPHLTIIPIGVKAYVADGLFVGGETMFGSPHILVAQAGVRF